MGKSTINGTACKQSQTTLPGCHPKRLAALPPQHRSIGPFFGRNCLVVSSCTKAQNMNKYDTYMYVHTDIYMYIYIYNDIYIYIYTVLLQWFMHVQNEYNTCIYHHLSSYIIIYHHLSSSIIIYHHLSSYVHIYIYMCVCVCKNIRIIYCIYVYMCIHMIYICCDSWPELQSSSEQSTHPWHSQLTHIWGLGASGRTGLQGSCQLPIGLPLLLAVQNFWGNPP